MRVGLTISITIINGPRLDIQARVFPAMIATRSSAFGLDMYDACTVIFDEVLNPTFLVRQDLGDVRVVHFRSNRPCWCVIKVLLYRYEKLDLLCPHGSEYCYQ